MGFRVEGVGFASFESRSRLLGGPGVGGRAGISHSSWEGGGVVVCKGGVFWRVPNTLRPDSLDELYVRFNYI